MAQDRNFQLTKSIRVVCLHYPPFGRTFPYHVLKLLRLVAGKTITVFCCKTSKSLCIF
jgi:hypothetical protein